MRMRRSQFCDVKRITINSLGNTQKSLEGSLGNQASFYVLAVSGILFRTRKICCGLYGTLQGA